MQMRVEVVLKKACGATPTRGFHHILMACVREYREAGRGEAKGEKLVGGSSCGLRVAILIDMRTIWVPSGAEERGYYDRLFQLADVSNTGKLAGQSAVLFLARSGLAFPILKQVNNGGSERKRRERKRRKLLLVYEHG